MTNIYIDKFNDHENPLIINIINELNVEYVTLVSLKNIRNYMHV
jgi:hypothetical protein